MIYIQGNQRFYMKYNPQADDKDIASLRVTKRTRRKLGMLINGNQTLDEGLEEILNKLLVAT